MYRLSPSLCFSSHDFRGLPLLWLVPATLHCSVGKLACIESLKQTFAFWFADLVFDWDNTAVSKLWKFLIKADPLPHGFTPTVWRWVLRLTVIASSYELVHKFACSKSMCLTIDCQYCFVVGTFVTPSISPVHPYHMVGQVKEVYSHADYSTLTSYCHLYNNWSMERIPLDGCLGRPLYRLLKSATHAAAWLVVICTQLHSCLEGLLEYWLPNAIAYY